MFVGVAMMSGFLLWLTVVVVDEVGEALTGSASVQNLAASIAVVCLSIAIISGAWTFLRARTLRRAAIATFSGEDGEPDTSLLSSLGERGAMIVALHAARRRTLMCQARADEQTRVAAAASAGGYELVTSMVQAEERIRAQLVADLHDTVAQELVVAGYVAADTEMHQAEVAGAIAAARDAHEHLLSTLPSMLTQDMGTALTALTESLRRAHTAAVAACGEAELTFSDTIARSDRQLRAVMAQARPPELADADLTSAVADLVESFAIRDGLAVEVSWTKAPIAIPYASALTMYRFCQETLRNVVKHAGVDQAWLTFEVGDGVLSATVRDRGRGMRPDALNGSRLKNASGHHVGLELLQNRAALLGARVDIDSTEGSGTTVTLHLPSPVAAPTVAGTHHPVTRTVALGDRLVAVHG
jgi:two-component system sensor histidine kinase UhpB